VSDFFSFLKTFAICGTVFFVAMMVMLSLPKSQLRSVGLQCIKYALAAGLFLLIPSPVDCLPDVVPGVGWLDDIGYVIAGIAAVRAGNREGRQRKFEQECENLVRARQAGLPLSDEQEEMVASFEERSNGRP
jgi:uncharacterized membrane protein YkvA (DUF1232 family)